MKSLLPMYDEENFEAPKTLGDWVKNFRIKKMQMKRKFRGGGNLRVCAIMATALTSAENQLRLKQQERLSRYLQLQSKFQNVDTNTMTTMSFDSYHHRHHHHQHNNNHNQHQQRDDEEEDYKRRMEITNLWRSELNGLDEFMRKMSSSSSCISNASSLNDSSSSNCSSEYILHFNDSSNDLNARGITVSS